MIKKTQNQFYLDSKSNCNDISLVATRHWLGSIRNKKSFFVQNRHR